MYFVGISNDPVLAVGGVKAYLIYILFRRKFWVGFCENGEKISFSCPDFADSKIVIWGLTSIIDFYKGIQLLFKKQYVSDYEKKFTFLIPDDIKNY